MPAQQKALNVGGNYMETSLIERILQKVDSYSGDYLALKNQAKKYLRNNSIIDNSETLNILHRPWVAPFNWGLRLYNGADKNWPDQFEQKTLRAIPDFYKDFLLEINGCFIYDLSLFGLTPSIFSKGTLDRTQLQCHDLLTANTDWIQNYKVDKRNFHFGGRSYTFSENIGYFFDGNEIKALRSNGRTIKSWQSFSVFLDEEIREAEKIMIKGIPKAVKISKEE